MTGAETKPLAVYGAYGAKILHAGGWSARKDREERRMRHTVYRIVCVSDGVLSVCIGRKREDYGPGDAVFLTPGVTVTLALTIRSRIIEVAFVVVHTPLTGRIGDLRPLPGAVQPDPVAVWDMELPRRLSTDLSQRASTTVELIRAEYWRNVAGYVRACGRLTAFLADVVADAAARCPEESVDPGADIERSVKWHVARFGYPLPRVAQLAKHMGVSREHLSRVFKATTSLSLGDWLEDKRWRNAEVMLADGNRQIKEVAFFAGFRSTPAFGAAFRAHYGCSPTAWRRKVRGTLPPPSPRIRGYGSIPGVKTTA